MDSGVDGVSGLNAVETVVMEENAVDRAEFVADIEQRGSPAV